MLRARSFAVEDGNWTQPTIIRMHHKQSFMVHMALCIGYMEELVDIRRIFCYVCDWFVIHKQHRKMSDEVE